MFMVDIFVRLPSGSPLWIGSVDGLREALARLRELNRINPGDYFLYSEQNGRIQHENHLRGKESLMRTGQCRAGRCSRFLQLREKEVAALAHLRWLLRGFPEGSPEVDWFAAELDFDQKFLAQLDLGFPS